MNRRNFLLGVVKGAAALVVATVLPGKASDADLSGYYLDEGAVREHITIQAHTVPLTQPISDELADFAAACERYQAEMERTNEACWEWLESIDA